MGKRLLCLMSNPENENQSEKDPKLVTLDDLERESQKLSPLDENGNLILEDEGFRLVIRGDGTN